jgi:hypothetical protein
MWREDTAKGEGTWTCMKKLVRDIWCSRQWFATGLEDDSGREYLQQDAGVSFVTIVVLVDVWTDL